MSVIVVSKNDTIEIWRQKTNLISTEVGDITLLNTVSGLPATDIVSELNARNSLNIGLIVALA